MKQIFSLFAGLLFVVCTTAHGALPEGGRWGAGLVIGDPTALTGKYMNSERTAIDFGLSFNSNYVVIYGDHQWNFPGLFGTRNQFISELYPYVGVGGGVASWSASRICDRWGCDRTRDSSVSLYLRIPLGVEWHPQKVPLGVFFEIVPAMSIVPASSGFFNSGLGIRYYF